MKDMKILCCSLLSLAAYTLFFSCFPSDLFMLGVENGTYCFNSSCSVADMLMLYGSVLQLDIPIFYLYFFIIIMLYRILLTHTVVACVCKL